MKIFSRPTLYVRLSRDMLYMRNVDTGKEIREKPALAIINVGPDGGRREIIAVGDVAEQACSEDKRATLVSPFQDMQALSADHTAAERLLSYFILMVSGLSLFRPRPVVVFQPLDVLDGGLTDMEKRAFRGLFKSAGARKFTGWIGHELGDDEIRTQSFGQQGEVF